jgi:hypothetical protein
MYFFTRLILSDSRGNDVRHHPWHRDHRHVERATMFAGSADSTRKGLSGEGYRAYGVGVELTSVSAVRGVAPHDVVAAVEAYLDGVGLAHARATDEDPDPGHVRFAEARDGWATLTWPSYFVPHDLAACRWVSRELHTVVSTVTTTEDEGWSHTLFGCGTQLDRFHSYPAALVWDDDDVASLAREWAGDFELVARVLGVDACAVRRHFCQATSATRDHPGRDRHGYLALWSALGIRVADAAPYAVLAVDQAWQRRSA